jgi:hypothetical protein
MRKLTHFGTIALSVGMLLLAACTNTNYSDLMRVTNETDVTIAAQEKIYSSEATPSERLKARDRIVRLREKQMIMARRIAVKTMPEVQSGKMTFAEGEARKAELLAAATARYEQARAMPKPAL